MGDFTPHARGARGWCSRAAPQGGSGQWGLGLPRLKAEKMRKKQLSDLVAQCSKSKIWLSGWCMRNYLLFDLFIHLYTFIYYSYYTWLVFDLFFFEQLPVRMSHVLWARAWEAMSKQRFPCLWVWLVPQNFKLSEFQRVSEFVKPFTMKKTCVSHVLNCFKLTAWAAWTDSLLSLRWLVLPLQHQNILNMWSSHKPWKLYSMQRPTKQPYHQARTKPHCRNSEAIWESNWRILEVQIAV